MAWTESHDTAPGTTIGPGNVISANLIGVLISGAMATGVTVIGNLIGTDSSGEADLGNAEAGVDIESATGVIVEGNGQGSQVISGNLIGVEINGSSATGNLVEGNYIGIDEAGTADRGNASDGVLIEEASDNTVGGTTAAARNVISANLWGIRCRRFHRDRQSRRGQQYRNRSLRDLASGQRDLRDHSSPQAHRTTRSAEPAAARATHRLQCGGRRDRRVGDGRLHSLEQHLLPTASKGSR